MKLSTFLLSGALLTVTTYAVGLTVGIGPHRVARKFEENIALPLIDKVMGNEEPTDATLRHYSETACPGEEAFAIAYFGQSNATNTVKPRAEGPFPANLIQYDWKSRKCFAYQEPLLGADFLEGNDITYAAIDIAKSTDRPVVVIPFGFGPSSILEWAYGRGSTQLDLVLERLHATGISPQVFLWHQGESDVPNDGADRTIMADVPYFERPEFPLDEGPYRWGLTRAGYENALREITHKVLSSFPDARFGIALVSIAPCLGRSEEWQPLRDAEADVAAQNDRVFISADSDAIRGPEYRYDSCHFNKAGAQKLSAEYVRSLTEQGILDIK